MERPCDRYALSTAFASKKASLEEILPSIARHGFRFVELWADEDHCDPRVQPDVKGLRSLMDSLGLEAHSVHTPYTGLKLGHPRPELLSEWLRIVGRALEIGADMGARIAVVHPNSDVEGLSDDDYADSKNLSIEFVNSLANRAETLGIRLAVETMLMPAPLTRLFGSSLGELLEAFPDARIGFCPDLGHAALTGDDLIHHMPIAGERLLSIHADSNDGQTDLHLLPSQGVVDWEGVKQALRGMGYKGRYVLELSSGMSGGDPWRTLDLAAEFVRKDLTTSEEEP